MAFKLYEEWLVLYEKTKNEDLSSTQDIVDAVNNFAKRIKIEKKKGVFEVWVYLEDRESQAPKINDIFKDAGFEIEQNMRSFSQSYPVTEFMMDGLMIRVIFKPLGGQQATTLNSTITELIPILLWKANYTGGPDSKTMLEACRKLDLSTVTWSTRADKEAAEKYLDIFEDSSLYEEKMQNAFGIFRWIQSQKPKNLIWSYRVKPVIPGGLVPDKRADIVVEDEDGYYGISLKAKTSGSAKIRKMSTTFFEVLRFFDNKYTEEAKTHAWNNVFSSMIQEYKNIFPDNKNVDIINQNNFWDLVGPKQIIHKQLDKIIEEMYKLDPKHLDEIGYYRLQSGAREILAKIIKEEPDRWIEFFKNKMGMENVFPVKVIVVIKDQATEMDEDTIENIAGVLDKRPVTVDIVKTNKKSIKVSYDDYVQTFEIRNNSGGNKTNVIYRMAIDQVG
jgi:hypothetical protein